MFNWLITIFSFFGFSDQAIHTDHLETPQTLIFRESKILECSLKYQLKSGEQIKELTLDGKWTFCEPDGRTIIKIPKMEHFDPSELIVFEAFEEKPSGNQVYIDNIDLLTGEIDHFKEEVLSISNARDGPQRMKSVLLAADLTYYMRVHIVLFDFKDVFPVCVRAYIARLVPLQLNDDGGEGSVGFLFDMLIKAKNIKRTVYLINQFTVKNLQVLPMVNYESTQVILKTINKVMMTENKDLGVKLKKGQKLFLADQKGDYIPIDLETGIPVQRYKGYGNLLLKVAESQDSHEMDTKPCCLIL